MKTKKKRYYICVSLVSAALVFSTLAAGLAGDMPSTDGEEFWKYISETDSYLGWGFWPGYYGIFPGRSPHGAYVKIFANGIALKAAREGKPMPYGAIVVKENYGKDKTTLMAITPMYKVKNFNPRGGDWFWAKYEPDGKATEAGKVGGCIGCHAAQKTSDWIFMKAR